jgi:hypothetical protein
MTDYAKYLINQGVNPNDEDGSQRTPQPWVSAKDWVDIIAFIFKHIDDSDVDDIVGGKSLLRRPSEKAGVDLSTRNNDGESLLHVVAKGDSVSLRVPGYSSSDDIVNCFRFLIEMGWTL